ncbi:MAG TPA: hypothetical protein VFA04_12325 [Bryobacteraceae bacterium]|nr:hypothetical protein [Bryobacteraceae bacterium]
MRSTAVLVPFAVSGLFVFAQDAVNQPTTKVPLVVSSGVPIRLYLTKRLSKRENEPVQAKVLEPVFAFDRAVIPAGSQVLGHVARLEPVSKTRRVSAVLNGDFTPLHRAEVEFDTLVLPDGRRIPLKTAETTGLSTIATLNPPKKKKTTTGVLGIGRQQATDAINRSINSRTRGVADVVRGPDKKEHLEELLVAKLPWHPQWIRKGTRFDAELRAPLNFGVAEVRTESLRLLGTQPPPDSIVHARLVTPLDSGTSKPGERVEAVISEPLFTADRKLILPEGARLVGAVTIAEHAKFFHRGGRLRFNFKDLQMPPGVAPAAPAVTTLASAPGGPKSTLATLSAAEQGGPNSIKVDDEGGVKATESKTRLLAPAIAALIATKSMDNDAGKANAAQDGNPGGRTLGGASGLGLLGMGAAQISPTIGSALGMYGLAWSVYTNVVARGSEVTFGNNAAVDIRFGARPQAPPAAKFVASAASSSK